MKNSVRLTFIIMILTAAVAPARAQNVDKMDRLARDLISALSDGKKYEAVKHLFLAKAELKDVLDIISKQSKPRPGRTREQMRERNRRRLLGVVAEQKKRWNRLIDRMQQKNISIQFRILHQMNMKIKQGLRVFKLRIKMDKSENNKNLVIRKTVRVIYLNGKLRVVKIFSSF